MEEKSKKNKVVKIVVIVISVVVGLFILFQIIRAVLSIYVVGVEVPGIVKYDDCRQIITIQEKDSFYWNGHFGKQFTCDYRKTKSGRIMGGTCVLVNLDSNSTCESAYVYQKKQDPTPNCEGTIKDGVAYPYLGYDDLCHTTPQ